MTRDEVADQALSATTLDEIEQARQALRDRQREHPEERVMYECFEMLYMMEEAARAMAAEEAAMTEAERTRTRARRKIERQVLSSSSLAEVEAAEQALCQWMRAQPDDEEMRGLFQPLALFREAYEILDAAPELAVVS